jgi:hypothetical protein
MARPHPAGAKYGVLVFIAVYGVYRGGGVLMHAVCCRSIDRRPRNERLSSGEVLAVLAACGARTSSGADLAAWRLRLLRRPGCATRRCGVRCRRRSK